MKVIFILAGLALYVAYTDAQTCTGQVRPERLNCRGGKDEGYSNGRHCAINANNRMWYFNQRTGSCVRMPYRGCGGNYNRHCSLPSCRRKCIGSS